VAASHFEHVPDHNAISGYVAMVAVRYALEKAGKLDGKNLADVLHGLAITTSDEPNILLDSAWDVKGDLRCPSFPGKGVDGKIQIIGTLN